MSSLLPADFPAGDADLYYLQLFNRRNLAGLNHFHKKFYRLLEVYVYNMLKGSPESENIPDDCFTAAWHSTREFETVTNLKNFLIVTAHNMSINLLNSPRHNMEIPHEEMPVIHASYQDMNLEDKELYERLLKKIKEEPEVVQKVINDKWEGMKNRDIAEKHGISQQYVASILSKFKKWIRGQ